MRNLLNMIVSLLNKPEKVTPPTLPPEIMKQIVISILFQLFIRMSANLRSVVLNKYFNDFDIPELVKFTNFNLLLSRLRKLKALFTPLSQNILPLLEILSSNCMDLHCLD